MPNSPFAQYKGELVVSLKYVTEKHEPAEKSKGKTDVLGELKEVLQ